MSGGGGKGGAATQVERNEIPSWLSSAAQENLRMGRDVARTGYVPYSGPDIAAFTQPQLQAMQMAQNQAAALGLAPQADITAGLPQAQQYAGGVSGYSAFPLYEQALQELAMSRPKQYAAITGQFIDPGGQQPTSPGVQAARQATANKAAQNREQRRALDARRQAMSSGPQKRALGRKIASLDAAYRNMNP